MNKKSLINIFAIIIILFSGVLFYLKYQNYTIKNSAIAVVKQAIGLDMEIGDIEYAPISKTAKLKDVTLKNLGGFDNPELIKIAQIRINEIKNEKGNISFNEFEINGLKMYLDADKKGNHSLTYLYRSLKNDLSKNTIDDKDKNISINNLNIRNITINPTISTANDMPESTDIKDILLTNIGIEEPIKMHHMLKITTVYTIEQSAFKIGQAKINHAIEGMKSRANEASRMLIEQGQAVKEKTAIFSDKFKTGLDKFGNNFEKAFKNQMETDPLGLKKMGLVKDEAKSSTSNQPTTPKTIEELNPPIIKAIPELAPAVPNNH